MKNVKIFAMIIVLIMSLTACNKTTIQQDWQEQFDLGVRFLNEENYEEAIIAFEAAIKIEPKKPEAYIGLADIYIKQGDEDKAREILERGLENNPENEEILSRINELKLASEAVPITEETALIPKPTKDYIIIKGVQYSTSLTELDLSYMELTNNDIIELSEMKNLIVLDLTSNELTDLSPLSELTNLTKLSLKYNPVKDIRPLANLKKLTCLSFYGDWELSDVSPLSELINLTELDFWGANISDVAPLSGLINLTDLALHDNNITDISPLANLTNLKSLSLNGNNITDISPLAQLKNLTMLDLSYNSITDISSLSELNNLTSLRLDWNNVTDISSLVNLTNLEWLLLYGISTNENDVNNLKMALPNCNISY